MQSNNNNYVIMVTMDWHRSYGYYVLHTFSHLIVCPLTKVLNQWVTLICWNIWRCMKSIGLERKFCSYHCHYYTLLLLYGLQWHVAAEDIAAYIRWRYGRDVVPPARKADGRLHRRLPGDDRTQTCLTRGTAGLPACPGLPVCVSVARGTAGVPAWHAA